MMTSVRGSPWARTARRGAAAARLSAGTATGADRAPTATPPTRRRRLRRNAFNLLNTISFWLILIVNPRSVIAADVGRRRTRTYPTYDHIIWHRYNGPLRADAHAESERIRAWSMTQRITC